MKPLIRPIATFNTFSRARGEEGKINRKSIFEISSKHSPRRIVAIQLAVFFLDRKKYPIRQYPSRAWYRKDDSVRVVVSRVA